VGDIRHILDSAAEILTTPTPRFERKELEKFVGDYLKRRDEFLDCARRQGSPLYIIERPVLRRRAEQFMATFKNHFPAVRFYFAVKSNNHPAISETLVQCGFGLDVSSGEELKQALQIGASDIIFSGPGKTFEELELAVANSHCVTVLIDSFGELDRLDEAAKKSGVEVRAGVRLTTEENGLWRKFGIPLSELPRMWDEIKQRRHVNFMGLQFHTSWNMNPDNQIAFLKRLGKTLASMNDDFRSAIKFIDIGGGYWPPQGEWLQLAGTPEGRLRQNMGQGVDSPLEHYRIPAVPIETFAREISSAVKSHLSPLVNCAFCFEPGRWICNDAMHLLLKVIDKKAGDLVITDAGTNAVGWERYETDYFPVINLSRPGLVEHECHILGSLCTPHDVWGFAYFGDGIEPGDHLLIPTQGAYTYSLRQNFIKPLPKTAYLETNEE